MVIYNTDHTHRVNFFNFFPFLLVLENQYREVSFSTTGQQVVMVSPGVGVFEVGVADAVISSY